METEDLIAFEPRWGVFFLGRVTGAAGAAVSFLTFFRYI
jgi:hypothetical protein